MKFMTWTLNRPSSGVFDNYYKLKDGEPWYSDKYEAVNLDYFRDYPHSGTRGFVETLEKYPEKFDAIGMHEFGISDNGDIFNMGYGSVIYPNGYYYNDPNMRVLNETEDDIERPVPTSLLYFMHKYPKIRWALQFLATANLAGDRVTSILNNERKPLFTSISNGAGEPATFEPRRDAGGNIMYVNAQDEFIRQAKRIAEIYVERGFPISDIEIDMEKTWSEDGEDALFANLLARVKREICLPLGLGLRVNLFAMTGDYNPDYYGWHNYATVAGAEVDGVQAVDEFQLMTYDFSWGGSAPDASTPLWWLEEVLTHVKALEVRGLWKTEDVYVGNAGYGRRWPLGENRMGVTFDFKQMVQMQNGGYIHNDGEEIFPDPNDPTYSVFPFNNQDFIPFSGYNDPKSDYQINYLHVYDRFQLSENGGASFRGVNRPKGQDYVTNYSLTQSPLFTGLVDYVTAPSYKGGRYLKTGDVLIEEVQGELPVTTWEEYRVMPTFTHPDTGEPTGLPEDDEGHLIYTLNVSGTFRLIAQLTFPFYDRNNTTVYVNGEPVTVSTGDWYPISLMQRKHFYDLGEYTVNGPLTIELRDTGGVLFGGFVATREFEHNLTGGSITFPTSTYPFIRRGERLQDGSVEKVTAQFPDVMRLVGEILRRPPRPAIIWEDVFSSYITSNGEGYNILDTGYYSDTASGGFTGGAWSVYEGEDYAHAYTDSRGSTAQLMLDNVFNSSIMLDAEVRMDMRDSGVYGLRLWAQRGGAVNNGYALVLDHDNGVLRLEYKSPTTGHSNTEVSIPMSDSLKAFKGQRLAIKAYILDGKVTVRVDDRVYLNEYTPKHVFSGGAYGFYVEGVRAKIYKYNISSLERYERMERLEVSVDGQVVNLFGEVERTVDEDEYGFLIYKGYPADIAEAVKNPSDMDGEGTQGNSNPVSGTILETERYINDPDKAESWSRDYLNKALATVEGWALGEHEVSIRMVDAGIWFRRFFVGDNEGMSISYNSDRVGFIRTANMVSDANCKGIAMWTLGQEDPTIYTYLVDSW